MPYIYVAEGWSGGYGWAVMFVLSVRSVVEEHKHVPRRDLEFMSPVARAKLT
jgi:hypothetical protein